MKRPLCTASLCAPCVAALRPESGKDSEGVTIRGADVGTVTIFVNVETSMGVGAAVALPKRPGPDDACDSDGCGGEDTAGNLRLLGRTCGGTAEAVATLRTVVDCTTVVK